MQKEKLKDIIIFFIFYFFLFFKFNLMNDRVTS